MTSIKKIKSLKGMKHAFNFLGFWTPLKKIMQIVGNISYCNPNFARISATSTASITMLQKLHEN